MLRRKVIGDAIKVVSLHRPEARNALSLGLLQELHDTIDTLHTGRDPCRVLILDSAVPNIFCAGADLKERKGFDLHQTRLFLKNLRGMLADLSSLEIPSIAAIDGPALGGGLELALACDFRILGKGAVVGLPEVRLGIIPGAGGTYRLRQLIGATRAKELILTGRRLDDREALRYGIATGLAEEPTLAATQMAEEICLGAPLATAAAKQAIDGGVWEDAMYERVVHSEDRQEGLKAFSEKRKPHFRGH